MRRRLRYASRPGLPVIVLVIVLALPLVPAAHGRNKNKESIPRSVGVDVHWGAKRNREVYRADFERAVQAVLVEKACFRSVVAPAQADVVLDVQLDDLATQQEYQTAETMVPGQGEHHELRSAKASVKLDYSLRTPRPADQEILGGRFYRSLARQPQTRDDPAEARALNDLIADAARWVVRELCDRRGRLAEKIDTSLGPPASP